MTVTCSFYFSFWRTISRMLIASLVYRCVFNGKFETWSQVENGITLSSRKNCRPATKRNSNFKPLQFSYRPTLVVRMQMSFDEICKVIHIELCCNNKYRSTVCYYISNYILDIHFVIFKLEIPVANCFALQKRTLQILIFCHTCLVLHSLWFCVVGLIIKFIITFLFLTQLDLQH